MINSDLICIQEGLEHNPYPASSFLERVLASITIGDSKRARDYMAEILPFIGSSMLSKLMLEITNEVQEIKKCRDIYYLVGNTKVPYGAIELISKIRHEISCLLEVTLPTIIVDYTDGPRPLYSLRATDGFGLICISKAIICEDDASQAIAHEIAHCIYSCGNRLIDEGFACFAERLLDGTDIIKSPSTIELDYSLRYLLVHDWTEEHGFESLPVDQRDIVYQLGTNLISIVVRLNSISDLPTFFSCMRQGVLMDNIVGSLEDYLGMETENIELACGMMKADSSVQDSSELSVEAGRAFLIGDGELALELLERVEKLRYKENDFYFSAAHLKILSVLALKPPEEEADIYSVAEFLSLAKVFVSKYIRTPEAYLFEAFMEILQIKASRSLLELQERHAKVVTLFEQGISEHPSDPNLRVAFVSYVALLPGDSESYDFDSTSILEPVLQDSQLSLEIKSKLAGILEA